MTVAAPDKYELHLRNTLWKTLQRAIFYVRTYIIETKSSPCRPAIRSQFQLKQTYSWDK